MDISKRGFVVLLTVVAVTGYPAQFPSDDNGENDDDGLRRALLSIQQQRRQAADGKYDWGYPEYPPVTGGDSDQERGFNAFDEDDDTTEGQNVAYRAILEEMIRRMKGGANGPSQRRPENDYRDSNIFGPPIDDEEERSPKYVDESSLESLLEPSGSDVTESSKNDGNGDDDGDFRDFPVRKEDESADKRSEEILQKLNNDNDARDEQAISKSQLEADLLAEENQELMDALNLATLSQITRSVSLIPNEIKSIKNAIEIENLLQGLEESEDVERPADKRGDERVLERVHHAQQKLPLDECPVSSYDFNCKDAESIGPEFVNLCRRHDICYSCGGLHGISHEGCDEGFLADGERICKDDWCTLEAAKLFLNMQRTHQRLPDTEDIDQCKNPCILDFIMSD